MKPHGMWITLQSGIGNSATGFKPTDRENEMAGDYILEDFEDDKRGYRQLYAMLAEGGSDLVYERFLELDDEATESYWVLLLSDMVTELQGLFESMMMKRIGVYECVMERIAATQKEQPARPMPSESAAGASTRKGSTTRKGLAARKGSTADSVLWRTQIKF